MSATIDLQAYFRRIGHDGPAAPGLETLQALHLRHPQAIAFENLDPLAGLPVELDPAALQHKLIQSRRGGYCFEHNTLFQLVLAELGFNVDILAACTLWQQPPGRPTARGHMALKLTVGGEAYLADVGFGSLTLTAPLRLRAGPVQTTPHGRFRLLTDGTGYRLEAEVGGVWQPVYRFDAVPASALDIAFANHYLSRHPDSAFARELLAARVGGELRYALRNDRLSVHRPDGTTERRRLDSPEALRRALQETFALDLPEGPALDAALARLSGMTAATSPVDATLRPGVPDDDIACGHIISAATRAAPTADRLPHARALLQDASPLAAKGGSRLVGVDAGGQVLGFVDFDAARGYVHYLFVAPEVQDRGIGTALLDAAQAALGGRALTLSCWAVNDRALDWYLRRDFRVVGGGFKELAGRQVVRLLLSRPSRPAG